MSEPTNSDIMRILGRVEEKVDEVQVQVRKTNGRVTLLEKWKDKMIVSADAIKLFKQENPTSESIKATNPLLADKGIQQLIKSLALLIGAIAAVLVFFTKGGL